MPRINTDVQTFARISVIGVGGSGTNAVNHMVSKKVEGVEFIAVNTDTQSLHTSKAKKKVHIGKNLTEGLGAGMDPEVGRKAAEENRSELQDIVKNAHMIFITCGMGGGTGTGAAPVVAEAARDQGVLTVAIVTKPFFFEGKARMQIALKGIEELEKQVDAIIVIPNDKLLAVSDEKTSFSDAFAMADEVLRRAVEGISDLIVNPGRVNVDFADIQKIMRNTGSAIMGIGSATGENRAERAAMEAINSPLLDLSIEGAKGVLLAVACDDSLGMHEVETAARIVTESIDPNAKIIWGTINDSKLKKDELKITVIATGFPTPGVGDQKLFDETEKKVVKMSATPSDLLKKREDIKGEDFEKDEDDEWSAVPAFLRRGKK